MPVVLYRAVGTAGKRGRGCRAVTSLTQPGPDLATAACSSAPRSNAATLLDIVRAVNATRAQCDRRASRRTCGDAVPALCWAVVSSDSSWSIGGADRGLTPDMDRPSKRSPDG